MQARCLIVDDESPARDELRYLLSRIDGVVVVGEATTAEEAGVLIGSLDYDVVLLDIRMPGMGGLALAEVLSQRPGRRPSVIFTTAYTDHAVEAFDLDAADYLVKPLEEGRLRRALQRALDQRDERSQALAGADGSGAGGSPQQDAEESDPAGASAATAGSALPSPGGADAAPAPSAVGRIPVHRSGRVILIEERQIAYAEAARGYAYLKLADERLLASFTLNDLAERLSEWFVRTHRSYLVNLRHVREVIPDVGGTLTLVMADKERSRVPVSRRQAPEVRRRLGM